MTEVLELPLDQIQQRVVAMWLGSFYGSSGYVAKKLGRKGLREFQDIGAHQVAATFKKLGLSAPGDVALAIADTIKVFWSTDVPLSCLHATDHSEGERNDGKKFLAAESVVLEWPRSPLCQPG